MSEENWGKVFRMESADAIRGEYSTALSLLERHKEQMSPELQASYETVKPDQAAQEDFMDYPIEHIREYIDEMRPDLKNLATIKAIEYTLRTRIENLSPTGEV